MQIAKDRVVTLAYTLKDNDDNIIDQSEDGSFCYLHGASNIIPGLENALTGKAAGDEDDVRRPVAPVCFDLAGKQEYSNGDQRGDALQVVTAFTTRSFCSVVPGRIFHRRCNGPLHQTRPCRPGNTQVHPSPRSC